MTSLPLQDDEWRDDNSRKCHDFTLGVLREELVISRKALREIAEPYRYETTPDYWHELHRRRAIAVAALKAIEAARAG